MKKLFFIIPFCLLLLLALRFFGSPLAQLGRVYYMQGDQKVYAQEYSGGYLWEDFARVDFEGGHQQMLEALQKISAQILMTEQIDNVSVIYAYSPRVYQSVELNGHKVNVMASTDGQSVHIGTPMLLGSY